MIRDEAIDKLVNPIIKAHEDFEFKTLQKIAERIRQIRSLPYEEAQNLVRSLLVSDEVAGIQNGLIKLSNKQVKLIREIFIDLAKQIYSEAKPLYKYRNANCPPFKENEDLCAVVFAIIDEIEDEYLDCTKSNVFVIRTNPSSPFKTAKTLSSAYKSVLNEALQVNYTNVDFDRGMARTIEQLCNSGIRKAKANDSGEVRTYRITSLIKTALIEKTKQLNTAMQAVMAGQFGADGIEISAHLNSAPDHEPIQGRQFLKEEFDKLQAGEPFKDIHNREYEAKARPIGAWNCRHWTMAIIIGKSVPQYTEKKLNEMEKNNAKGYTAPNGKHYTLYECTQAQRSYEKTIVEYATKYRIAKSAGNAELQQKYFAKYKQYVNAYMAFSKACGLPVNKDKI